MRKALILSGTICWALIGIQAAQAASPQPPEVSKCQACHGSDGNSVSASVPRLNGQQPQYIANRLRSFADITRQSAHATYFMWDINSSLSNAAVVALAESVSTQPKTVPLPTGARAEQGRKLYENGAGPQLPACQRCHGARAEGQGAIPRLAGQHAQYLRQKLEHFTLRTRVDETMNPHTRMLNQDQITALVAYLAKD